MFIRNKTRNRVGLARTVVNDELSAASAVVFSRYRIESDRLVWLEEPPVRSPASPPDPLAFPLWKGVSVTAIGQVVGPPRAPFIRQVNISVGDEVRRLAVFGGRRWRKTLGGDLVASDPEPFDTLPLVFTRAFGGFYNMTPGLFPGTNLALREVWWKHGGVPSSRRPRSCRRSQRKGGARRLVMERAQPTGYLGGHYTHPWSPIDHARHHSAQYCARNQVHSRHGRRVHARWAGLRSRADDGDSPLRRVRSPGEEGIRPAEAASLAPP